MKNEILSHLPPDHPWGQSLYWYEQLPSTNALAKNMAAAGAPQGTVLLADSQSAGRGRLGRSFHSPGGAGLYLSVILRPHCPPAQLMHLTCAVGVAVCDAVEEVLGFRPGIKWVNDLVVGDRKLGGILAEASMDTKTGCVSYAIVGIGINCNQHPADFPNELQNIACSAAMATGTSIDRARLAAAIICHMERMSHSLSQQKDIMARYRHDCVTIGKDVNIIHNDQIREGQALNVEDDGSLLVRFDDGSVRTVNSGDVSVRGLFGYV